MKKIIFTDQEKLLFESIKGFTNCLQKEIKTKKSSERLDMYSITTMPTYEFAALALQLESPFQLIKVIEVIKKRYAIKLKFERETLGFLDSLEGKAYGCIAMRVTNLKRQYELANEAIKCFKRAISRGYLDATIDLADIYYKFFTKEEADKILESKAYKVSDAYTKIGESYYSFSNLVESAIRVLEGKRAFIENIDNFNMAKLNYKRGCDISTNCKMLYSLACIIDGDKEAKIEALKVIKDNFIDFKSISYKVDRYLFASDAKVIKDNIKLIEEKLLKIKIR